jgi:hypothetical protein
MSFSKVRSLFLLVLPLFDILVDVRGKLWGEDIIRQYIGTLNLRYRRLDPAAPNDAVWKSIRDWRELIRLVLNSRYINIFIDSIPLGPSMVCYVEDSIIPSRSH